MPTRRCTGYPGGAAADAVGGRYTALARPRPGPNVACSERRGVGMRATCCPLHATMQDADANSDTGEADLRVAACPIQQLPGGQRSRARDATDALEAARATAGAAVRRH